MTNKPKTIVSVIGIIALVVALAVGIIVSRQSQDIRQRASSSTGTAIISLRSVGNVAVNNRSSIEVLLDTKGAAIDGVQFKITFDADPEMQVEVTPLAGLNNVTSLLEGTTYTFASLTSNPSVAYTNSQPIVLAQIIITPKSTETIHSTFDPVFTKIISHNTSQDIALTPLNIALAPRPADVLYPPSCVSTSSATLKKGVAPFTVALNGGGIAGTLGLNVNGYHWDLDGNGTVDITNGQSWQTHTYTTPGSYNPVYKVTDIQGNASTTCDPQITVEVTAPNVTVTTTPNEYDHNNDGVVDLEDYNLFINAWRATLN